MVWKDLIAGRLRDARSKAGLSQEELADTIGLTALSISKFETGRRQPRISTIERVAEATGMPLGWFFSDSSDLISKTFHQRLADQLRTFLDQEQVGLHALLGTLTDLLSMLAWTTDKELNITGRFGRSEWNGNTVSQVFDKGPVSAHRRALDGVTTPFVFDHGGAIYVGRVSPLTEECGTVTGTLAIAMEAPQQEVQPLDCGDRDDA